MSIRETKMDHLSRPFEIKALSEAGEFEGYGSVFGNIDSYDDVVMQGAFKGSLSRHESDGTWPMLLWQHRSDSPVGEWLEIREDERGLRMKGKLWMGDDHPDPLAIRAYRMLKSRGKSGLSIGFRTITQKWNDALKVRELSEVDLMEVSIVAFPANTAARVDAVKAADEIKSIRQLEQHLREHVGLSRDSAKAIAGRGVIQYLRDAGMAQAQAEAICGGGYAAFAALSTEEERDAPAVDLSGLLSALREVA